MRNPYPRRIVHRGHLMNDEGGVSALCFKRPRAIDMTRATWVGHDDAVTCRKCLAIIAARRTDTGDGG